MDAPEGGELLAMIAPRGNGAERLRRYLAAHGYLLMMAGAAGVICGSGGSSSSSSAGTEARAKMLLAYVMWIVGCGFVLLSMLLLPTEARAKMLLAYVMWIVGCGFVLLSMLLLP